MTFAGIAALAEPPTYNLGRIATPEELRAFPPLVSPEGKGLPAGRGTAREGARIYAQKCAHCHGANGEGQSGDLIFRGTPLVGGHGTLATPTPVRTAGSFYPYATTFWEYTNRTMPRDAPGTLTTNEVYALTAWMLHRNGIIGQDDAMDPETLPRVKMPNRDGFVPPTPEWKKGKKRP